MPLSSSCRNCGLSKTPDYYGENYCKECTAAIQEAQAKAEKENQDIGAAKRAILAERAHSLHHNRADPRNPLTKAQYWNFDPRRENGNS